MKKYDVYNLNGIFENKTTGDYYWLDCLEEDEVKEAKYFAYENEASGFHQCKYTALDGEFSASYDAFYIDKLQNEETCLNDSELYVVTYFVFDPTLWGLEQRVDFGITKQEIIDNVKARKYVEGATYFTMGHVFYATRMMMAEIKSEEENIDFDYYEIEFGILADGAQTGDYEAQGNSMCIKAKKWPRLDEAAEWLKADMKPFGYDCVHSVTRITEQEALASYYFDGTEPIWG